MGHLSAVMDKMGATRKFSAIVFCLALVFGLAGTLAPALAQQQEKRIALVVGNGAYAKSPLATAANDAGLIAQTLQAAGFDVVGARDLDGDTLRRSLRDFLQKAEQSGPDTVAMIYLAGYGVQLAGENYFIPVDSPLAKEGDIPIEGVRLNDYLRRLGSLPMKASIVVLDAAREQPFIEGGQPIAGGLALVEPEPRMLIAFNAAPGTVAPSEPGPYGAYAQSMAEMIRTGGLPLPELFDRLRLRVNEASKGAQVPWHAQKLDTNFVFFDRAPDAPQATSDQVAAVRNKPIRDLGPRDAYAAALERDTLQGYDDFVAAYPGDALTKRVRALAAARREALTWMRTYRADTPQAYWSYLRRYPNGPHAEDARRRLAILTQPLEPPPAFAVMDYDVPPPPPEEIVYVNRPVVVFSDPYYGFAPPPPPPVYFLPPPPPDFVILAPPPPPIGLFILPQPFFVPMPVYVRAPVYVAPPPNNIIFANIHNTTVINTVINRPPPPQGFAPGQGGPGGAAVPPGSKGGMIGAVPAMGGATPALPPSVAQRATLIQQGKAPVPPSAAINPAIKPGGQAGTAAAPNVLPANAPPGNAPALAPQGQQPLPRANALPVPGTKGAPPAPSGAATGAPGAANPNARLVTPSVPPQGAAPATNAPATPPPTAGAPKGAPTNALAPVATPKPSGAAGGPGSPPKPGPTAIAPSAPPPAGQGRVPPHPAVTSIPKPPPGVAPVARTPPPPPSQMSRTPPPPPPRIASPSPPPRVAAPPPPPPRVSAPPPPPPRVSAPPPPPARMAAPPPPPPPRMAAPPPPRPVAPPPAAAKRCPPNVPKC
jgi:uncharacterized caspase-like protein